MICSCSGKYMKQPYMNNSASEEQEKKDQLECKFEASKANGYDWIDKAINKREIMDACLEARGYTRGGI